MNTLKIMVAILAMLTGHAAYSQTIYEAMFPSKDLSSEKAGLNFNYAQSLTNQAQEISDQRSNLSYTLNEANEFVIVASRGELTQLLGTFPASIGNPVNMYFLERIVDNMAASAGGSPFYIRNRLKDALLRDEPAAGDCLNLPSDNGACMAFQPFINDEARIKMGAFADLKIEAQIDPENSASIIGLSAFTLDKSVFEISLVLEDSK